MPHQLYNDKNAKICQFQNLKCTSGQTEKTSGFEIDIFDEYSLVIREIFFKKSTFIKLDTKNTVLNRLGF